MDAPIVVLHHGIHVVRDDLYLGGTKARYVGEAFDDTDTVVYASPCEGGAQTALAIVAKHLQKRAVIVCAKRKQRHDRTIAAELIGAEIVEVSACPRLSVIQKRARDLALQNGWKLAPFGLELPGAVLAIRDAAISTGLQPDEVWSVGASGVLARGLAEAWPKAERHVVRIGHAFHPEDVAFAEVHTFGTSLAESTTCSEFPSDEHYDAKAWSVMQWERKRRAGDRVVLFWNVTGPASLERARAVRSLRATVARAR